MLGDSTLFYDQARRRRRWAMNGRNGLAGYAAFLAGADDGASSIAAAETAAFDSALGDPAIRAIAIGVATGVVTFLINHWLGKVLK